MGRKEVLEKAYKILMTWSKEDLVNDILELTNTEGLRDFVEKNEINEGEESPFIFKSKWKTKN